MLILSVRLLLFDRPNSKTGLTAWAQSGHDVLVVEILASDEIDFAFRESMVMENLERPGQKVGHVDPGAVRRCLLGTIYAGTAVDSPKS